MAEMKPPKGLGPVGRRFWRAITGDYEGFTVENLEDLRQACAALDTIAECDQRIAKDGLVVVGDRGGMRAHPLMTVKRAAERSYRTAMKRLKLDEEPEQLRNRFTGRFAPVPFQKRREA